MEWDDLFELLMDLAEHVKATKRPVVLDDDPLRLRRRVGQALIRRELAEQ